MPNYDDIELEVSGLDLWEKGTGRFLIWLFEPYGRIDTIKSLKMKVAIVTVEEGFAVDKAIAELDGRRLENGEVFRVRRTPQQEMLDYQRRINGGGRDKESVQKMWHH